MYGKYGIAQLTWLGRGGGERQPTACKIAWKLGVYSKEFDGGCLRSMDEEGQTLANESLWCPLGVPTKLEVVLPRMITLSCFWGKEAGEG